MFNLTDNLEEEIEKTKSFINYYVSRGDPSIEIIVPNQFRKLDELKLALEIVKKYNVL